MVIMTSEQEILCIETWINITCEIQLRLHGILKIVFEPPGRLPGDQAHNISNGQSSHHKVAMLQLPSH